MIKNLLINIDKISKKKISSSNILCIGDIMLDIYVYGNVNRMSPEAPIPILLYKDENFQLGGVGNVARNLSDIGARCTLISMIGKDSVSNKINKLIKKEKKIKSELVCLQNYIAPVKTRYINNSVHLLRVDREKPTYKKNRDLRIKISKILNKHIMQCDLIILSDYNKGFLDKSLITEIINIAKQNNKLIIVDPKKIDFSYYEGVDILTPNQKEISDSVNKNLSSEKEIIYYARKIITKYKIKEILVTRASKGMLLIGNDYTKKIPAIARVVRDVTGAGDTVVSILGLMKAIGLSSLDASNIANFGAGIIVEKPGTASLSYSELMSKK